MNRIKIIFDGVSDIVGLEGLSILILTDTEGNRQITIVCEREIARQIEMRIVKLPIVELMLPEVLCTLLQRQYGADMEIMINGVANGQYKANLYCGGMDDSIPIRISDAILMSIAGGIPMYIDAELMYMQSTQCSSGSNRVSVPINALTDEMLNDALEKAIADENYELASQLNKEQKRREKTEDTL